MITDKDVSEVPDSADDTNMVRAKNVLNRVILIFSILTGVGLISTALLYERKLGSLLIILALLITIITARFLAKLDQTQKACILAISGIWLIFAFIVFMGGGLNNINVVFFVSMTVVSGLLLGERATRVLAGAGIIMGLGMALMDIFGYLPNRYFMSTPFGNWSELVFALVLTASTLNLALRERSDALNTAKKQLSDRIEAEKALRESEELYDRLIATIPDLVVRTNIDGEIQFVNDMTLKVSEYKRSELIGKNMISFVAPEDQERAYRNTLLMMEQPLGPKQYRLVMKDGKKRVFEANGDVIRAKNGVPYSIVNVLRDITDRQIAEEERLRNEKDLRESQRIAHLGSWRLNVETSEVYWTEELYKMYGFDPTLPPPPYTEHMKLFTPESWELLSTSLQQTRDTGIPYELELEMVRADGSKGWMWVRGEALKDSQGKTVGLWGAAQDITERKQTEEALQESEEKFRSLSENAPDIIYTLAFDGSFTYVNPAWKTILGHEPEAVLGQYFVDFVKEEDARKYVHIFKEIRNRRETFKDADVNLVHKDGSTRLFSASGAPNINRSGEVTGMVGLFKDITDQRKLEKQLRQSQRMEAIGTLGGGIAHDFNNLLMGIQGRTSLMLMDVGPSHPHFEHLKGIEDYVKSAANLTKQLLGFARGGKYEVKPIDINELIKTGSRMFGRTKKEIQIHWKYQKDVWTIEADRGQIEQVLMNLYVNAWQAMPSGGELYLQTENVRLDENYVEPFEIKPGKYVKISVTDTGVGMDEATRQRIFDPFFTTKDMGRGTGLGLASAYGIIKNHGGFINVYSEKGEGATFNIYLPASEKEVIGEKELSEEPLKGSETVLFVDDEEMIIEIGEQLLQKLGYELLVARGGKEAIGIFEKNKEKIDIVILDMIMPDMSGGDTFDRLREIKPDIKVILSSGYSINGTATEILDRGCDGFIQKPFNTTQLSRKLREILDKK